MTKSEQPDPPVTFTTDQVAAAVGVSYRRIDYWVRRRYLPAPTTRGSGHPRTWTREQAEQVATFAALVHAGVEPIQAAVFAEGSIIAIGPVTITLDVESISGNLMEGLANAQK